jgi:hypothetical protein
VSKEACTANEIINALIAVSSDAIWATELALLQGGRRVDFWTLVPAASQGFRATAYEVKISRSDFKRDTDDKQSGALRYSDRFYYVTPPGLIAKGELPAYAGLQEWNGKGFSIVRRAPMRAKSEPDWEFIVSILRNSGDCRRDVGLLKAQLAFHESQVEQWKTQERFRNQISMDRWTAKARSKILTSEDAGA